MAAPGMKMQLVDWLDDLSVRFIINLPQEELESSERICFQIEEAQWYYEDFVRPLDPTLPSLNLRKFCNLIFQHCPILADFSDLHAAAYTEFMLYKTRVPVRGAIMLNEAMDSVVLVKGWKKGARWSFPRGKINKDERDLDCAIREVDEETGFDLHKAGLVPTNVDDAKYIDISLREQQMRLYVFRNVPMDTYFEPKTRKEISKIEWWKLSDLPTLKREKQMQAQAVEGEEGAKASSFYMVAPFLGQLRQWIKQQKRNDKARVRAAHPRHVIVEDEETDLMHSDAAPEVTDTNDGGGHFTSLLAQLRSSNADVPAALQGLAGPSMAQNLDPASELKRLLSIGGSGLPPPPSLATKPPPPVQETSMNPLLAILKGSGPSMPAYSAANQPPRTPMDQIHAFPPMATTPHHHHPQAPANFQGYAPPPQFNLPAQSNNPTSYPPSGAPNQAPIADPVVAPSASSLPAPNLSSQKLALLNAFGSAPQQPSRKESVPAPSHLGFIPMGFVPSTVRPGKPALPSPDGTMRAPSLGSRRSSKQTELPESIMRISQPMDHKNALLGLFKGGKPDMAPPGLGPNSVLQTNDMLGLPGLAELAAQVTPHIEKSEASFAQNSPLLPLNTSSIPRPNSPGLTSATVTGPLNAPDFEKLQPIDKAAAATNDMNNIISSMRQQPRAPAGSRNTSAQRARASPRQRPGSSSSAVSNRTPTTQQKAFHPTQILKRPAQQSPQQQPQPQPPTSAPSASRAGPQILARPAGANPADQQKSLLALFSNPGAAPSPPTSGTSVINTGVESDISPVSDLAINSLTLSEMPAIETPPTAPKLIPEGSLMGQIMSPLSPLAGNNLGPGIHRGVFGAQHLQHSPLAGKTSSQNIQYTSQRNGSTASLSEYLAAGRSTSSPHGSVTGGNQTPTSLSHHNFPIGLPSQMPPPIGPGLGLSSAPNRERSSFALSQSSRQNSLHGSFPTKERVGSMSSAVGGTGTATGTQTPITPVDKSFLMGYLESVAKGA